jgi:CRISPR-associated protein Cas2
MLSDKQQRKYYIICYDIEDTKKRNKLAKWLTNYGVRVQKSVFEAYLNDIDFEQMLLGAEPYIDSNDSLRIYELTQSSYKKKIVIGEPYDYHPYENAIV